MSEVSDRYARVARGFSARLEGCPPDKLDGPSPCQQWTGRDVANHVVQVHRRVLAALDGSDAREPEVDEDLLLAFGEVSEAVSAALVDPARATKTVAGIFGEQQLEQLVGRLLCADTLVHTWDLARANAQDDRLDADRVDQGPRVPDAYRRGDPAPRRLWPEARAIPGQRMCRHSSSRSPAVASEGHGPGWLVSSNSHLSHPLFLVGVLPSTDGRGRSGDGERSALRRGYSAGLCMIS